MALFSPISEITPSKESWSIMGKIVRLWVVTDFVKHKIPFSVEMVLIDDKVVSSCRSYLYDFVFI